MRGQRSSHFLYFLTLQDFFGSQVFVKIKAAAVGFNFPQLIVIGIGSPVLLFHGEIGLEGRIGNHTVGIQITEVESAAFFRA